MWSGMGSGTALSQWTAIDDQPSERKPSGNSRS
jgi:hypothetical protein